MNPYRALREQRMMALRAGTPVKTDFRAQVDGGTAELYLYDMIDEPGWFGISANDIVTALAQAGGADVLVHVNSPGGLVTEGLAIYNTFKNYEGKVTMRVEGMAASAASFVVLAGNQVVTEPNAMWMIHDAWGVTIGPEADHHAQGDLLGKLSDNMSGIYANKAGKTSAYWRDMMRAETWYTGQEAYDAGLADTVNDASATDTDAAAARWSGIFARAPHRPAEPSLAPVALAWPPKPPAAPAASNTATFEWASLRQGLKGVLS